MIQWVEIHSGEAMLFLCLIFTKCLEEISRENSEAKKNKNASPEMI